MSKKIIAILTIATILFVCIFAACGKENLYADNDLYDFVTDKNGEKVFSDDGRFLVYATDQHGERVTNASGEDVTSARQFEPVFDGDIFEDYGFKVNIPDGWKLSTEKGNVFVNKSEKQDIKVGIAKDTYENYYTKSLELYNALVEEKLITDYSWEEDINLIEDVEGAFRCVLKKDGVTYITVVFKNSENVYYISFSSTNEDPIEHNIASLDEFLGNITFKPYTYYPELATVESTSETK